MVYTRHDTLDARLLRLMITSPTMK